MNQLTSIREAGYKSAEARRKNDEATAKFHKDWADRAIYLEDDKQKGRLAFSTGYAQFSAEHRIKAEPFR